MIKRYGFGKIIKTVLAILLHYIFGENVLEFSLKFLYESGLAFARNYFFEHFNRAKEKILAIGCIHRGAK